MWRTGHWRYQLIVKPRTVCNFPNSYCILELCFIFLYSVSQMVYVIWPRPWLSIGGVQNSTGSRRLLEFQTRDTFVNDITLSLEYAYRLWPKHQSCTTPREYNAEKSLKYLYLSRWPHNMLPNLRSIMMVTSSQSADQHTDIIYHWHYTDHGVLIAKCTIQTGVYDRILIIPNNSWYTRLRRYGFFDWWI